jgi:hypothetical protein
MSSTFFKSKTTDHSEVFIRKDHISAIEVIPGKGGLDPMVKLYVNGYSFKVLGKKEDYLKCLEIPFESLPLISE